METPISLEYDAHSEFIVVFIHVVCSSYNSGLIIYCAAY